MGVKRADKRKMDEKRVEVGVTENVKKQLVRITWAGLVMWEKIIDEKLAKRADAP